MKKNDSLEAVLKQFFLETSKEDRILRFCYPISDEDLESWVENSLLNKDNLIQEWVLIKNLEEEIRGVGFLSTLHQENPKWCELSILIKKEERGRGLGTLILSELEESVKKLNIPEVFVFFLKENTLIKNMLLKNNYQISFSKELNKYCGYKSFI